jgi:hypothetical protein
MPVKNVWLRGIWRNEQFQKALAFALWILSFVLLRWLFVRLGMAEGVVGAFGALLALAAAGVAILLLLLLDRLILGRREEGKVATWLKVVTALGLAAAVVLAVWSAREGYRFDHPSPAAADPVVERLQHDPDVLRGMEAMRDLEKLKAAREKGAATMPATNP